MRTYEYQHIVSFPNTNLIGITTMPTRAWSFQIKMRYQVGGSLRSDVKGSAYVAAS